MARPVSKPTPFIRIFVFEWLQGEWLLNILFNDVYFTDTRIMHYATMFLEELRALPALAPAPETLRSAL